MDLPPTGLRPRLDPNTAQPETPPPRYSGTHITSELDDKTVAIMRTLETQGWLNRVNPGTDQRLAAATYHRATATQPPSYRAVTPRGLRASVMDPVPGRVAAVLPTSHLPSQPQAPDSPAVTSAASAANASTSSTESIPSMEAVSESLDSKPSSFPTAQSSHVLPAEDTVILNNGAKDSLKRMRARLLA